MTHSGLTGRQRLEYYELKLVEISRLKPHEKVVESHVERLIDEIRSSGVLMRPILVERKHYIILDGHHRVEALKRLGAKLVPAILLDYGSPCVTVTSWRPCITVTKDDVIRAALTRKLFPPKTSRHRVCFEIPRLNIPLYKLM
ncbi:ParB N-terminal domain-containing protein [Hyperthermus butylicus]|uniref:Transcriptional regulator n=1 Tax=Hyperthermus butylicus (strain DSM 5456 / JCM 9403 / PLM1-5) TaxID=415426 RepID=A2BN43_HYPBU|nr:ParB N-terminal domain-containing protein [Hyperthermus butylicus]ABM81404.1 putative transcriptional regulator [Hyperthermus butylicus DSM 5456]